MAVCRLAARRCPQLQLFGFLVFGWFFGSLVCQAVSFVVDKSGEPVRTGAHRISKPTRLNCRQRNRATWERKRERRREKEGQQHTRQRSIVGLRMRASAPMLFLAGRTYTIRLLRRRSRTCFLEAFRRAAKLSYDKIDDRCCCCCCCLSSPGSDRNLEFLTENRRSTTNYLARLIPIELFRFKGAFIFPGPQNQKFMEFPLS